MELVSQGRVWARIQGWEDWRFDTDERVWPVMHRTEGHLFATPEGDGVYMVCDPGRSEASRDYLATRFLGRSEREQYEGLAEARKVSWLYGRIAAKDAVRADVRSRTGRHLFPVEVPIEVDRQGRPIVGGEYRGQYHVSIGHKDDIAVAIASSNAGLGIDIERVAPRDETFATTICAEDELTLLPDGHRDVWLTRVWCAKEVIGKRRGTGITGSPKAFSLQRIEGETLVVEGLRVMTRRVGDYVIGWCV
jgi:phosphopantetheinyl transferase